MAVSVQTHETMYKSKGNCNLTTKSVQTKKLLCYIPRW